MRILLSYTLVGRGGDAIQVQALADAFRHLGHEVELVGPHALQPYEFRSPASRLRSRMRRLPWWAKDLVELGFNRLLLWRVRRLLRWENFDLIFHRAGIYDSVGLKLAGRCPLVAHLDAPFPLERAFRGEGHFSRLHQRAMRALGQSSRLIATVSEAAKAYYVQLGLPEEKIFIMPNGIPERLLQQGLWRAQERPPFAQGPPWTVGFVGSLSRWHRVDLLLEALRLLNAEGAGRFRLLVIGYGEEYEKLRTYEGRLGLAGRVEWPGPLSHEETVARIAEFDVAVLPHTLPTGAPLKLFEYAALARPTIAPDLPNLRGLFAADEMRFVSPDSPQALAEAVSALSREPEAARQLGERAQQRVQQYTWEDAAAHLLQALRNTI